MKDELKGLIRSMDDLGIKREIDFVFNTSYDLVTGKYFYDNEYKAFQKWNDSLNNKITEVVVNIIRVYEVQNSCDPYNPRYTKISTTNFLHEEINYKIKMTNGKGVGFHYKFNEKEETINSTLGLISGGGFYEIHLDPKRLKKAIDSTTCIAELIMNIVTSELKLPRKKLLENFGDI